MTLHLVKLCVGINELAELQDWIAKAKSGSELDHVTRMFPKRAAKIHEGGSLFWVIRGLILCRQPIAKLESITGKDGISRCRIVFKRSLIAVRPTPRRPFQGWRYLEAADAPPDLNRNRASAGLSEKMRRELGALGLL